MINLPSFGKGNPAHPPSRMCAKGSHEWCVNRDVDETGCGCACHRPEWDQAVARLNHEPAATFATSDTPGYCRYCHRHEWAHDGLTGACPPEREPDWFVIVSRMYDEQELYGPFPNQEQAEHYGKHALGLPMELDADNEDFFTAMPTTMPNAR